MRSVSLCLLALTLSACPGSSQDDDTGTDETDVAITDEPADTDDSDPVDTDMPDDTDDTDVACPDGDLDGVCDADDVCQGDDATGDEDGDHVCNDQDVCQGDDATGDADVDLICDDLDLCAGDDAFGDVDSDLICDNVDLCEGDNGTLDGDGDGVCGDRDQCAGGDASGDSDGDLVCDDIDACSGDDASGDADLDLICDELDACFGDDGTGDTDGDGVCDSDDACWGNDASGNADGDSNCDDRDLCPGAVEDDVDGNGWPDACEPRLLATYPFNVSGYGASVDVFPYAAVLFELPGGPCGAGYIGDTAFVGDGGTAIFTIDSMSDPDFSGFAQCLTNGTVDSYAFWGGFSRGENQAWPGAGYDVTDIELGANPDFTGKTITSVELEFTSASVIHPFPGGTSGDVAGEFRFYGFDNP